MIAQALFGAQSVVKRAERELEQLLDSIFTDWQDYETDRASRSIDVFGVFPTPLARERLQEAGFANVHQHDHDRARFLRCVCRGRAP